MNQTDCRTPNNRTQPRPARQARIRRIFDGVIASYIHEISTRAGKPISSMMMDDLDLVNQTR
jgi:hypothetical protein